jgi:hypothetical protein
MCLLFKLIANQIKRHAIRLTTRNPSFCHLPRNGWRWVENFSLYVIELGCLEMATITGLESSVIYKQADIIRQFFNLWCPEHRCSLSVYERMISWKQHKQPVDCRCVNVNVKNKRNEAIKKCIKRTLIAYEFRENVFFSIFLRRWLIH